MSPVICRATAFFAALAAFGQARAFVVPSSVQCAAQAVHADMKTLDLQPAASSDGTTALSPYAQVPGHSRGEIHLKFPAKGSAGIAVDLALDLELGRSGWIEGAPRLTVQTRVRDVGASRTLAIYEDHSDKILRERMVASLRDEGPRVVYQIYLTDAVARLDALADAGVASARALGLEQGFAAAAQRRLINADEIVRVDVACFTPSGGR